ncbi:MAG: heavy metal-binding domain-containing protein [Bacilli bacterium]|nr:heavy metal-binding domain-containing protein [Bacilli bacterium]
MIISTTPTLEGKTIKEYRGVVFGEVISGIHFMKDFTANFTDMLGGRAEEYEEELVNARADAINEMIERAKKIGANALVGVKTDVEIASGDERRTISMLMITVSGTAVVVE